MLPNPKKTLKMLLVHKKTLKIVKSNRINFIFFKILP